ncbi:hypothetical protein TSUD_108020 [Trifolium subterraneum]|uniref:Reverse transcriptase Ty1/copia-type domain-containing protein n=1 Tax=Trifolium subterraneum TaxID=3900 RepID=A0A2Z6M4W5_TRISU|nr:hypothetical protein TSUD_108020 [Trifolium subterraneum]
MASDNSTVEVPIHNATGELNLPPTSRGSSKSGLTHSLTIKLDEKNFLLWSQQVNGVITAHNLHRFVVNPEILLQYASIADRLDGKNSEEYKTWLFKDQSLFTWLLSTISDGVLPRVLNCKHSHEVWEKIHKYFNSVLKSRARQLRSELKNTKKSARSMSEYLLRIKSIVNSLIAMGDMDCWKQESEKERIVLLSHFVKIIVKSFTGSDNPTVEDIEGLLLLQEAQFEKFRQELANPSVSTNVAQMETQSNSPNMDLEGPPSRPPHFNPYPRPTAHLAIPQYYSSIPDMDNMSNASWYPDSGASHHLTYNPQQFRILSKFCLKELWDLMDYTSSNPFTSLPMMRTTPRPSVSPQHKGHKCLDANGRIYVSKDVIFHETQFPYPSLFPTSSTNRSNSDTSPTEHTAPTTTPSIIPPQNPPLTVNQINSLISQPIPSTSNISQQANFTSGNNPPAIQPNPPISTPNKHPMVTRGKTGNLKPKIFSATLEPTSVKTALKDPKWLHAMQNEYKALMDNKTWSLVPLPSHRKVISCKWIFKVKENPDGTVNKYKARLVARGFLQTPGFDFTETFSPVIKPTTIRIILTLVVTYKWLIQQIDVKNAFLNGVLQEEVYMTQLAGFEVADKTLVCKLHKSLYGLKQAPRAWYERLTQALLQMGFVTSKCDPSLLIHHQKGACTYVLIYVDDILITGSTPHLIHDLIHKLNVKFALKQLGEVDYFLGIEVHHMPSGDLLLNQSKYVRDLLSRTNMENCKAIGSPMVSSCKLSKFGTDSMSDPSLYRSTVGALQYATLTRPDISFSVNKVCQFMANPLETHWKAVKRILRYLKGTSNHGLLLHPSSSSPPFSLRTYSDADWATDQDDRRSTSGSCIYFGPNLSLLCELQVPYHTPTLLCDNLSAVSLAHNPNLHSRTKHIELDIHFVREKVFAKKLHVLHVPATDQLADPLTKSLSPSNYATIRTKLKVFPCHETTSV